MHSLTSSACVLFPHFSFANLNPHLFPSVFLVLDSRRRIRMRYFAALNIVAADSFKKGNNNSYYNKGLSWDCSGFLRRCKDWDIEEGDFSLESEILEFMKNSRNPKSFPTKKDLVDSGRMDLVDAIIKRGGWLVYGWDLDEAEAEERLGELHVNEKGFSSKIENNEILGSADFSQPAISSGRSVEKEAEESGIEGILNRLEKERNSSFGLGSKEKEDSISFGNNEDENNSHHRPIEYSVAADVDKSPTNSPLGGFQRKIGQHISLTGNDGLGYSHKPETWKSWVVQRNGSSYAKFEDAEITPTEIRKGGKTDVSGNDTFEIRQFDGKAHYNDIKSRIQHLESELSSVLHSLRTRADEAAMQTADEAAMQTGQRSSSDDLQNLSDAWEFQETEISNARDTLRSVRAKLAVLEGKMTLAIMDANKIVEEKQKRIDNAHRALSFLRTTCVVWPSAASEVLLAGSFDGWSTQRRMEKSSTGVFSVNLQLYPGKYEIKFIVDGVWKIDPLRPIVHNNGYENNLLIVHD